MYYTGINVTTEDELNFGHMLYMYEVACGLEPSVSVDIDVDETVDGGLSQSQKMVRMALIIAAILVGVIVIKGVVS